MDKVISVLGIDLAKNVFQVCAANAKGERIYNRQVTRAKLLSTLANVPPCLVGMEACSSSHYWAREIEGLGHRVKLMPPQYVKPYVKTNKNDASDADAICEAVTRPNMRFVAIKSPEQQANTFAPGQKGVSKRANSVGQQVQSCTFGVWCDRTDRSQLFASVAIKRVWGDRT